MGLMTLIRLSNENAPFSHIKGLASLGDKCTEVFRTGSRPLMRDLDALPFPAREWLVFDQYQDSWKSAHGYFSTNIVASRGCPYRCNGCAKPIEHQYRCPTRSSRSISGSPLVWARHLIAWSSAPCFPVGAEVGWCCSCHRGSVIPLQRDQSLRSQISSSFENFFAT
jgi:hypothetical protein